MKWYLKQFNQIEMKPEGDALRVASNKNEAKLHTENLLREQGLNWQAGAIFQTREMDKPVAWFSSTNKLMNY